MEFLKIFKRENIELIIIGIVFIVLLYLVLRDFNVTSKKSWGLLLGLTALGGIIAIRAIAKRRLMQELEDRENKMKEIEARYKDMKDNNKILEEDYNRLKNELEQVKKESYKAISESDSRLDNARKNIRNDQDVTKEELIDFLNTL